MNNYKIKIACTSKDQLCCNNEKISKKNSKKLNLEKLIESNDFVVNALILHKKIKNTTPKTLILHKKIKNTTPKTLILPEKLKNTTPKTLILPEKLKNTTTKTLEFNCKRDNEISNIDFETFIKDMKNCGYSSKISKTIIRLIKINNNEPNEEIFIYEFQSITNIDIDIEKPKKKPNKSTYRTEILCTKEKKLNN